MPKHKIFITALLFIILAELLSFLGYYFADINSLLFFIIIILTIAVSLYRLEYGLYILLAELFIGSFGYLFSFSFAGNVISIRLALWLIIMSAWLAKTMMLWNRTKKLSVNFFKSSYLNYFIVLGFFIVWGLANGFLSHNAAGSIFFDFNNWLYFLLILPISDIRKNEINILQQIFFASITWLSVKTIILAYFFSHNFYYFNLDLYRWVRESGAGEITQVQAGFSRIFMQSQIFILIGIFILLFYLLRILLQNKINTKQAETALAGSALGRTDIQPRAGYFLLLVLFLSAIIISFSRTFWLGLAAGGIFTWLMVVFKLKINFKKFVIFNAIIFLSIVSSLSLTLGIIKFPYPGDAGDFNAASLLGRRVTQLSGEAGVSSRWQLLPPLWEKIKISPIMGQGFGATVTYRSNDPRILSASPDGLYTTYAFEWGWLDVWLKLGLFGMLAYLALFVKIIIGGIKKYPGTSDGNSLLSYYSVLSLMAGLIILITVNTFSPYVNHPLGIGYLIIVALLINGLSLNNNLETHKT